MSSSPSSCRAPTPAVFALTQDLCIYRLLYCHKFRECPGLSKAKYHEQAALPHNPVCQLPSVRCPVAAVMFQTWK